MSETQKEKAAAMREATDIGTLIERVEAATGPSEELGTRIICALLAPAGSFVEMSRINGAWCIYTAPDKLWPKPHAFRGDGRCVTGSLDAAVALAEKKGDAQILLDEAMNDLSTTGWHPDKPFGPQLARYLLLALLRSLQEKSNG